MCDKHKSHGTFWIRDSSELEDLALEFWWKDGFWPRSEMEKTIEYSPKLVDEHMDAMDLELPSLRNIRLLRPVYQH
jgi:hypothetical protein